MLPEDEKTLSDIRTHGCHVIHVQEEDALPPFGYSVGIQRSSQVPEVIVVGLKHPMADFVINEYNHRIRAGEKFLIGHEYLGFLEDFPVLFEKVLLKHYEEYFGWNRWLYDGEAFDVVQMVYPNTQGVWPWDEAADAWFRARQPLLGR